MTFLWKKSVSDKYYNIQTTNVEVSRKLRKIKGVLLISYSVNDFNEIYRIPATNIHDAKNLLIQVTNQEIYAVKGGFMAKTQVAMDLK